MNRALEHLMMRLGGTLWMANCRSGIAAAFDNAPTRPGMPIGSDSGVRADVTPVLPGTRNRMP